MYIYVYMYIYTSNSRGSLTTASQWVSSSIWLKLAQLGPGWLKQPEFAIFNASHQGMGPRWPKLAQAT